MSGWETLDANNELTRVSTKQVLDKSDEIGHTLARAGGLDQGIPGQYNASHAEKQLSIISKKTIGISKPMCNDCEKYFNKLAVKEGKSHITADPNTIRIFSSDGTVNKIDR